MKVENMKYRFSAVSQHIFPVHINGRVRIVRFSERNQFGNSLFFTSDRDVAEAIRNMPMFKRGAITEITSPEELKYLDDIWKTKQVNNGNATDEAIKNNDPKEKTTEPAVPSITKEEVMVFDNFTQAKEWVCKKYDIAKNKVRKPETVASIALEKGIIIQYKEE